MNNFVISFKRFIKNKNTVTILGVVTVILVLFFGYRYQIKKATNPVTGIPVASVTIQPRTKITSDMVDTISVAPILLQSNVYRTRAQVVDKYTNYNTIIPEGSLFYKESLVNENELPDSALINLADGQVPYNFPVNMAMTYYNSIYPNNYIDIYMKAVNENGTLMVGKLIENVKVLAVKDSSGQSVFTNLDEKRTPAMIVFAVPEEYYILLKKAEYLRSYDTTLIPVPTNESYEDTPGELAVSSEKLKDWINRVTVWDETN